MIECPPIEGLCSDAVTRSRYTIAAMIRWTHLAKKIEGATRTTEKVRLLAEALRAMPDEELETACRLLISKPIARRRAGVEDPARRITTINAIHVPEGVDPLKCRKALVEKYNLDIGGS